MTDTTIVIEVPALSYGAITIESESTYKLILAEKHAEFIGTKIIWKNSEDAVAEDHKTDFVFKVLKSYIRSVNVFFATDKYQVSIDHGNDEDEWTIPVASKKDGRAIQDKIMNWLTSK